MLASWLGLVVLVGTASGAARGQAAATPTLPGWERSVLAEACGFIGAFNYPLYRLPGLTDDAEKGRQLITRVRCTPASAPAWRQGRVLRVLGAAPSSNTHPARPWILVALARNRAVRGWLPLHFSGFTEEASEIRWSKVPLAKVPDGGPSGLPDLEISSFEPTQEEGDPCYGLPGSPVKVYWFVVVRNAGPGAGPRVIRARIGSRTVVTRLTRRILPRETVTLAQIADGGKEVVLDPRNEVREADEGNNLDEAPSGDGLVCGEP
jgi:hypothetical protein